MRWIGLVAGVLTTAACAGLNGREPPRDDGGVEYRFEVGLVHPGTGAAPRHAVRGEAGAIVITGAISTPVPCYRVAGDVVRDDREITLRIVATPQDAICIQVIATWAYEASLRDLDRGHHRVTVVHSGVAGATAERVVLEAGVDVR